MTQEPYDVVAVGAGFAGLFLIHRLRALGLRVRVLEAGDDVGGTWYWNRYPGARCDVESFEYSFSFDEALQQEWTWSERYAAQPEILRYIQHVADRFDLRRDIAFGLRVTDAVFDLPANRWTVTADDGQQFTARFFIMASGCLSNAKVPDVPGLADFKGQWFHTGHWPREGVDFSGKRVGVVGTGSTGIQAIPVVAGQAAHLHVFQRTANYSIPLRNGPVTPAFEDEFKRDYAGLREQARHCPSGVARFPNPQRGALEMTEAERLASYEERWRFGGISFARAFNDTVMKQDANDLMRQFLVPRMLACVEDPSTRAKLTPTYAVGTKRLCGDTGYFETYNRDNVALVDIQQAPITAVTPTGIQTHDAHYPLDVIIFATGFDAITGPLLAVNMRVEDGSQGGVDLHSLWRDGPRAYLGLMVAGLPNLFTVTGPGSPSVLSNVVVSVEQHVEWIGNCLAAMRARGFDRIEAEPEAQQAWARHVDELARRSLMPDANSWYMGANIPGKPRMFMPYMGGVGVYRRQCEAVAAAGYTGFVLSQVERSTV
ncbi:MAG: cyclohexanone monooxygenase [Rhodoferax sp.]|nr:cyclohexanone monooxygenase [Rhodoferax sp.]